MEETSQDIGFTRNNQWFRYRAAGIIIKDDAVLMVGNDHNDYYYSVVVPCNWVKRPRRLVCVSFMRKLVYNLKSKD